MITQQIDDEWQIPNAAAGPCVIRYSACSTVAAWLRPACTVKNCAASASNDVVGDAPTSVQIA